MGARKGPTDRVYGPYPDARGGFRLVLATAKGERSSERFETERQALKAKELYGRELAITAGKTFCQAFSEYQEHQVEKGNVERSIETNLYRLGCMFGHLQAPIASFTEADGQPLYDRVRKLKDKDTGEPVHTPSSHRNILAESKTFLRWCVVMKYARCNFLEKVQGFGKRNSGKRKASLTMDEAKLLVEVAYDRAGKSHVSGLAVIFALMHDLRAEEITNLRTRDVDNDATLLHVTDAKTEAGIRTLEVAPRLQPILRRIAKRRVADGGEFLIAGVRDEPQRSRHWAYKAINKLCRKAGVPEVGPHGLRRTHATLTYEHGATAPMLELAMGHTSISVTEHSYIKQGTIEKVRQRKVIDMLDFKERHGPQRSSDDVDEPKSEQAEGE